MVLITPNPADYGTISGKETEGIGDGIDHPSPADYGTISGKETEGIGDGIDHP